jgi:hypothetical protein
MAKRDDAGSLRATIPAAEADREGWFARIVVDERLGHGSRLIRNSSTIFFSATAPKMAASCEEMPPLS